MHTQAKAREASRPPPPHPLLNVCVQVEDGREKVYLVGVTLKGAASGKASYGASYGIEESLEELGRLSDTAGLKVVGSTYQILETPNNSTYIGSGKVAQVAIAARALNVETVIFDDELSPSQLRNLEKAINGGKDAGSVEFPIKVGNCNEAAW
ncbi:hypothetical protein FOA52_010470 [Chlamydomonas sp. UWO 241]|nr:hypothetical protein FOA52_010470 [Chlamydomonas sp. UWO 241]